MLASLKRPGNEGKLDARIAQLSTRRNVQKAKDDTLVPQRTHSEVLLVVKTESAILRPICDSRAHLSSDGSRGFSASPIAIGSRSSSRGVRGADGSGAGYSGVARVKPAA